MAVDTLNDVLGAVPGAKPTSTYRTPEHNRRVGGVPGSFHTRGTPDNPQAVDLTPAPGETMEQLRARVAASGVDTHELINEGDHVHVAFSGVPSSRDPGGTNRPGYTVVNRQDLAPEDTPESLAAQGYVLDAATNTYARTVGEMIGAAPEPLDTQYAERMNAREAAALDQEDADLERSVQASIIPEGVVNDITKGVVQEGGQAIVSGIKRGFNATMDLVDEAGDWIEQYVPGTIAWEGFDGDASTPARIRLTTQNEAQAQQEGAQEGRRSIWQRLGAARLRAPQSEGERPETNTGRAIEGISQFMTGFAGGGKVLQGWKVAGRAGQIGKTLVRGALADFTAFDGQEARLSNLLAEHAPEALAPALNWLAADEDDGELEGRFKNAIEGFVLSGVVDVIGQGIRRLRAARQVRAAARDAAKAEGLQIDPTLANAEARVAGEQADAIIKESLGNPEGPAFRVKPDPTVVTLSFNAKVAAQADAIAGQPASMADDLARAVPTDNVFDINLARMDTPEAIQNVITGMADRLAKNVDLARRATISHQTTMARARKLDWVTSMAERRVGGAANAETITAYRLALNASATKLQALAQAVKSSSSTPAEAVARQYAMRRAATIHAAIQNEFMGARAEAGRALSALRIAAGTPENSLRQIDNLLAEYGSGKTGMAFADAIIKAGQSGDSAMNTVLRQGWSAKTQDALKFIYTNGLLSSPGTSIVNVVGNGTMLAMNIAARTVSPRLASAFGGENVTQIGEASALWAGYTGALRDMFHMNAIESAQRIGADGGAAWREQGLFRGLAPGLDDAAPAGIALRSEREEAGIVGGSASRPLSASYFRVEEDTVVGRALDIFHMVMGAPSNINALTDDVFKVMSARGELHAQVFRAVTREGLQGEAARVRMRDLLENPTDDMLKTAEQEMHDLTFTRETPGMATAFSDLRRFMDNNPTPLPLGTIFLPFIRTPANLISMGMRYSPLAPLSRRFIDDIKAGGAAAETAKAKVAVGSALWSVWIGMAMDGQITGRGPSNPAQRDAMARADENGGVAWQPNSVKIGDRWFSYERMDPVIGQSMSLISNMAELANNSDWDNDRNTEITEVAAHGIMSIGQAFFDKTILRSATEFTSAMVGGTTADGERLMMGRASGAIPYSGMLRTLRRGDDAYMRETTDVLEAMRNTVPGLSEALPVQRDLWGRARTYQTGLGTVYDAIVPVQTKAAGGSAIDLEILNNGVAVVQPPRAIQIMDESVSLKNRPDIYSRFLELSGQPAFEHLNAVAEGTHEDSEAYYAMTDGPDGEKAEYIKDVMKMYRADARAAIVDEYASDLQAMAISEIAKREQARAAQ